MPGEQQSSIQQALRRYESRAERRHINIWCEANPNLLCSLAEVPDDGSDPEHNFSGGEAMPEPEPESATEPDDEPQAPAPAPPPKVKSSKKPIIALAR